MPSVYRRFITRQSINIFQPERATTLRWQKFAQCLQDVLQRWQGKTTGWGKGRTKWGWPEDSDMFAMYEFANLIKPFNEPGY